MTQASSWLRSLFKRHFGKNISTMATPLPLSLSDLCLTTLRDSLEAGIPQSLGQMPPKYGPLLLDMVLMHGTANEPVCASSLASVEFLRHFDSLNTQLAEYDVHLLLDRVTTSLSLGPSDGPHLGSTITTLCLNLHGYYLFCCGPYCGNSTYAKAKIKESTARSVFGVIAQCPNLKSLSLSFTWESISDGSLDAEKCAFEWSTSEDPFTQRQPLEPKLLNRMASFEPCTSILEGLEELSLKTAGPLGELTKILHDDSPVLQFKKLYKLYLSYCTVDQKAWDALFVSIGLTMADLSMTYVRLSKSSHSYDEEPPAALPYPMPQLRSLALKDRCMDSLDTLIQYPNLKRISLSSDFFRVPADTDRVINSDITFNVDYSLARHFVIDQHVDAASRIRGVVLFGPSITSFRLDLQVANQKLITALKHMVDACPNLTSLKLWISNFGSCGGTHCLGTCPRSRMRLQARSTVAPIFRNKERALKLRHLALYGDQEPETVNALFENCLNLESFSIMDCPQVTDTHLASWAARGVRLSRLGIRGCSNVSDDGLIPLIMGGGKRLNEVDFHPITDKTWFTLICHCPLLKIANIPEHLKDLARSKLWHKSVKEDQMFYFR